jgi:hypothetical protein
METHRPTRFEHRADGRKKIGWMLHQKQTSSVWSVRLPSSLFSKFISKSNPSKMRPNKHRYRHTTPTTTHHTTTAEIIKTHQSPPSAAGHAVPPRPSAAAAHGVAHVDGSAAASFAFTTLQARRRAAAQSVGRRSVSLVVQSRGRQLELVWSEQARRFASWFFGSGCFGGGVVRQNPSCAAARFALLLAAVALVAGR